MRIGVCASDPLPPSPPTCLASCDDAAEAEEEEENGGEWSFGLNQFSMRPMGIKLLTRCLCSASSIAFDIVLF